jgi:hypothetical protein
MLYFEDWIIYCSQNDLLSKDSLRFNSETLDQATGSRTTVTQADTETNNDGDDWLYALAYSTDLVQRKDPQQICYLTKHMHEYFTQSINCKKILKSFPSNIRVQNPRQKRKAKDMLVTNDKLLESHTSSK